MTRGSFVRRSVGASLSMLLTLGALSSFATAEGEDLGISRVDVSEAPEVTVEFSAAFGLTGGALSLDQLEVLENGALIAATLEQVPTSGLEVVLVVDTSGSMKEGDAIGAAKNAAAAFLSSLPPEIPVGVVAFADAPALVSPLTTDRALLAATIAGLSATGETALYDAIQFAQTLFSGTTDDRQFVVLSDGGDTVSGSTLEEAVAVATKIRTNVIELVSSEANQEALKQLSGAANGSLGLATDPAALEGLFREVAASLTSRYRLHFTSAASGDVTYTLRVATPEGTAEATATAVLPTIATTIAPTTTVLASPPTTVTESVVPTTVVEVVKGSNSSLSTKTWLYVGAVSIFVSLLILALFAIPVQHRRRRSTAGILGADQPVQSAEGKTSGGIGARITSMAESALDRGDRRRGLSAALDSAAINLRPGEFLVLAIAIGVVFALVLFSFMGPIGFIVGVVSAPLIGRMIVEARAAGRRKAIGEQLPDLLQMMVSSLRSGYGLPQALDAVANQVADPARAEMQRVLLEVRIGRDPTDAMQSMADRMKSRDFEWVVAAIHINREVGGELAIILENVAETVRERQQLARQVRTLTAEGRLSAYVLTGLPFVLAVLLSLTSPGYFDPFKQAPGPFLVVLGVGLLIVGWLWMRKIIKAQL